MFICYYECENVVIVQTYVYFYIIYINSYMVELGKNNIFIIENKAKRNGIGTASEIFNFLDLIGFNLIHFSNNSSHFYNVKRMHFTGLDNFKNLIFSNLFKIDIIILDSSDFISYYEELRILTDLPIVFIINKSNLNKIKEENFDHIYKLEEIKIVFSSSFSSISTLALQETKYENYIVSDIKNNWKSNLRDLKIQYIRNKNLEDLLD